MGQAIGHVIVFGDINGNLGRIDPLNLAQKYGSNAFIIRDDLIKGTCVLGCIEFIPANDRYLITCGRKDQRAVPGQGAFAIDQGQHRILDCAGLPHEGQPQVQTFFFQNAHGLICFFFDDGVHGSPL